MVQYGMGMNKWTNEGKWLLFGLSLGALATVVCRYWVDLPVARWCWHRHYEVSDHKYSKFIHEMFGFLEGFGDYPGIIVIAALIFALDPHRRIRLFHFCTAILCTSLTINLIKLVIIRRRPQGFRFLNPDLVTQHDVLLIDWTPWASVIKSIDRSFPSGHTATAFAICATLSFFYPEGKRVFFLLAILVGVQRILFCAHFPSDVIVGAMIGLLIGKTLCHVVSRYA